MMTEAETVRHLLYIALEEVYDLRNINRYNIGNILSAAHYMDKAIGMLDRLIARDDKKR